MMLNCNLTTLQQYLDALANIIMTLTKSLNMKRKYILVGIAIVIIAILSYGFYYVNDYYHADDEALKYMNGTDDVSVVKTSNGLFLDGPGNDTAVIFYPGAKVEYTSYLPLLTRLSSEGADCFLVEMPFNIAFLGQNSADNIMDSYNYTSYYMAGHSLGGVVASNYINETNKSDGAILLESYSTKKIDKPVLSVFGSEDNLLNQKRYDEFKVMMGDNLKEVKIKGGNHAQIGDYGKQSGDGIAKITPKNQQKQCVDAIIDFIEK